MRMKKVLCAALGIGATVVPQLAGAQDTLPQVSLTCEVRCSPTKLRTAIAVIRWSGPAEKVGAAALAGGAPSDVALDVTVFRNGFARNRFTSFNGLAAGATTLRKAEPRGFASTDPPIKALDNLQVVNVQGSAAQPGPMATLGTPETGLVMVEIEGIEPGMIYQWRLRIPGLAQEVFARCEAPVCPADLKEEPK